jgi:Lsr2
MAQKTTVTLTCDMEAGEKPATETVRFSMDGSSYEMDLCDKHAKQFRDGTAPFVAAGRRVSSRGSARGARRAPGGDRERTQAIRAWARKKGLKVSERGRLSADIVANYEASGGR